MANLLEIGAQFHAREMPRAAGASIEYRRGGATIEPTAWPAGVSRHEVTGEDGMLQHIESVDWTVTVETMGGLQPRAGDLIIVAGVTHQVLPMANLPCFDRFDAAGLMYLIRTKRLR